MKRENKLTPIFLALKNIVYPIIGANFSFLLLDVSLELTENWFLNTFLTEY